jgi:hypothetical protein
MGTGGDDVALDNEVDDLVTVRAILLNRLDAAVRGAASRPADGGPRQRRRAVGQPRELWEPFDAALDRLKPGAPERVALAAHIFSDPLHSALAALGRLDAATAEKDREPSPARPISVPPHTALVGRVLRGHPGRDLGP